MRRAIAKRYEPSYICPLCEYLDKTELGIVNHLVNQHNDKDAWWND